MQPVSQTPAHTKVPGDSLVVDARFDSAARAWSRALIVFFLAVLVFSRYGHDGLLLHDDAIYLYAGQQMLQGEPVYVGVFDHKGPLGQLFGGLGAWLGRAVGKDAVVATRFLSLLVAAGTAAGMSLLASALFRSRFLAWTAGAVFCSFTSYGVFAYSGTRPKLLMLFFEVVALNAMVRRRWVLAGAASATAAFAWQPAAIFFFVALACVLLGEESREGRWRGFWRLVLGGALPTAAMFAYFLAVGAFPVFLDGFFLFNIRFLDNLGTTASQLAGMMQTFVHNGMGMLTVVGLLMVVLMYVWRIRRVGLGGLFRDRFAPVLLAFPFPVLWSLHDYQQYPDFFVFLPFVTLGIAWLLLLAAQGVVQGAELEGRARTACLLAPTVLFFAFAGTSYWFISRNRLGPQRAQAQWILEEYGDKRLAVVGVPQALVLMERSNVTTYSFLMRGIAEYIEAKEPGGFAGWLASIDATKPELLIIDERRESRLGRFAPAWRAWLANYEKRPSAPVQSVPQWALYVPRQTKDL